MIATRMLQAAKRSHALFCRDLSSATVGVRRVLDLRSDTVTQPTPAMRAAMAAAPVGDDVYGDDPTVNELQDRIATMFGMESALFFPSGTQSNLAAIGAHCARGDEIILGNQSHIFIYEGGGASSLMGVAFHTIPNLINGDFSIQAAKEAIRIDNEHYPRTTLICVENTHNKTGGRMLPLHFLRDLRLMCDQHNSDMLKICHENSNTSSNIHSNPNRNEKINVLKIHLDGARIFNASIAQGIPVKDLVQHVDTVSVCLSKGLGCPVGSILIGSKDFIQRAHRHRKALGGGMRQAGILAAACIYALDHHINRIGDDHRRLKQIVNGLSDIPQLHMPQLTNIDTNIAFFQADIGLQGKKLSNILKEKHDILIGSYSETKYRLTTHININDEDVYRIIDSVKQVCAEIY